MHYDTVVIGGGFTGLLSAIYLKELKPEQKILIVERQAYPFKNNKVIIMPPLVRRLLISIKSFNTYKFNEGRFICYNFKIDSLDIAFPVENCSLVNDVELTHTLYSIAVLQGIDFLVNFEMISVDEFKKRVYLSKNIEVTYDNYIDARGVRGLPKYFNTLEKEDYIDSDRLFMPIPFPKNFSVESVGNVIYPSPMIENLPKESGLIYKVGACGGYVDYVTYNSIRYYSISAVTAAVNIATNSSIMEYYKSMKEVMEDVIASIEIRQSLNNLRVPLHKLSVLEEEIKDILLYSTQNYRNLDGIIKEFLKKDA